ncbi:non-structural maintenance of chromosomes element 3 homolog [Pseudomyrmex gracilis]|uniref:non-structural maintenance of chromosomes element 3 homolog n=1 Tax=Pseudomyrmex gracilis TaxID=219809 RepID=UPI000995D59D|nr:non-structural maintenance of chromosomes element 3 homolog [Pseudomyrmex gracilis]
MNKKRRYRETQDDPESLEDMFSVDSYSVASSQPSVSHRSTRCSQSQSQSLNRTLYNMSMEDEEEIHLSGNIIRYLLVADRSKQPIQKNHIIKHVLNGNVKQFRSVIDRVKRHLSGVFGYKLIEVEGNKYILVNELENSIPHLKFKDKNKQVLLFLVLLHIFMHGESCKEELLWSFLCTLDIITLDNFHHDYFGDVKQLVTVEFVNEKYLTRISTEKNNTTQVEYKWGSRAENEISYKSVLEFVARLYGSNVKQWEFQYKLAVEQEQLNKL